MRFKKGDKVRLINNDTMGADIGATAEVRGCTRGDLLDIWWLDSKSNSQSNGAYYERKFEPAMDKREQAIYKRLCNIKRPKIGFKKGDKARIRRDLTVGRIYGGGKFMKKMDEYKGKCAEIISCEQDEEGKYYYIDIDDERDGWSREMFEGMEG